MLVKQNTDFFSREKQRIGIFYNQPKNQLKIKHNYFFRNPFLRNIAEPKILCDENFLFPSHFFHYCSVVLHYYHYLCYKVKYITIVPFIKRKSYFFLYFTSQKVWECIRFLVNMPMWMDQSRLCQFSVLPFPDRLHLEHCPDL